MKYIVSLPVLVDVLRRADGGKQPFTVEIRSLVDSICDKVSSPLSLS